MLTPSPERTGPARRFSAPRWPVFESLPGPTPTPLPGLRREGSWAAPEAPRGSGRHSLGSRPKGRGAPATGRRCFCSETACATGVSSPSPCAPSRSSSDLRDQAPRQREPLLIGVSEARSSPVGHTFAQAAEGRVRHLGTDSGSPPGPSPSDAVQVSQAGNRLLHQRSNLLQRDQPLYGAGHVHFDVSLAAGNAAG